MLIIWLVLWRKLLRIYFNMFKRPDSQFLIIAICLLHLTFCTNREASPELKRGDKLTQIATAYFETYAERIDMEKFMSFYHDSVFFEDPILEVEFHSARELEEFYNWSDTSFRKHPDFPKTLVIEQLIVSQDVVVGNGYFTPFYYMGKLYDQENKMNFSIQLFFNEDNLIVRHVDWIHYPPKMLIGVLEKIIQEDEV